MSSESVRSLLARTIRDSPDFPTPGVTFKDFTPLLADAQAFRTVVKDIADRYAGRVDVVAGIEARGFIIGAAVAYELGAGFVPIRKAGKLPGDTHRESYSLEYGTAEIEMQTDALAPGVRVLVLDDVLATGGTAAAACALIERAGEQVVAVEAILELSFLHGRRALPGREIHSLLAV
ncbi:MAG TPA: adenine phosphoribosyltransferase [Candidatus Lustribacter sp.]|nr:adenine phosphoribosyltransferase [Candidatus Lustribacter sp.]